MSRSRVAKITHLLAVRLLSWLCWSYNWLVVRTSSIRETGGEHRDRLLKEGQGFIVAFWHNRQFFMTWVGRQVPGVHVLVSRSRDGDYIAAVCHRFNLHTIRGSTSRGGAKALVQMMREVRRGQIVGITPDGPRGPRETVQAGIYHVALKTGCPILPLSLNGKRIFTFSSWDQFILPLPFNTVGVAWGKPLRLAPGQNETVYTAQIKEALDQAGREAVGLIEG